MKEFLKEILPESEEWQITLIVNEFKNIHNELEKQRDINKRLRERLSPTQQWIFENEKN